LFRLGFAVFRGRISLVRRLILPLALACGLVGAPSIARADDDDVRPMPRTAVTIGGASVVLVATTKELYAFVDQIETNAPVADAELSVDSADGTSIELRKAPLTMRKTTAGMFVGPLNRVGQAQGAFMVSLQSSAGSGDAPAEITYTDVIPPPVFGTVVSLGIKLAIAGVSAGIGAIVAMLAMLWLRGLQKRRTLRAVDRAPAT
jgi:hypothetical protein